MSSRKQDLQKLEELKKQEQIIIEEKSKTNKCYRRTKAYKEIRTQIGKLTYKLNKNANVYYHGNGWIYDLHSKFLSKEPDKVTGNNLTDWYAKQYNKIDGIVCERHYKNDSVYYTLYIITMKQIYAYTLNRGYDYAVSVERCKDNNGYSFIPTFGVVKHHICEMALGDTFEHLNSKDTSSQILDKQLNICIN